MVTYRRNRPPIHKLGTQPGLVWSDSSKLWNFSEVHERTVRLSPEESDEDGDEDESNPDSPEQSRIPELWIVVVHLPNPREETDRAENRSETLQGEPENNGQQSLVLQIFL